jgi:hypothetical protein
MNPTYFAQIDENNIVTQVIVASADFVASQPGEWVETFMDGAQRKNYAGIGYIYDAEKDAFYAPQPFPSWLLDEDCVWQAPVEYPADGDMYLWNETNLAWEKVNV